MALGLVFLAYPGLSFLHYDVDANGVAAFLDDFINNWPTGEQPWCARVPSHAYGFACWLLALAAFGLRREVDRIYVGRIRRGTE